MDSYFDEFFDVVDENDEVIGRERRPIVHAKNLLHRAVHGFVFSDSGQLFLQKRSQSKDTYPGTWDSSFSGHVDSGENYDQTAIREAAEELGLLLKAAPQRVLKVQACPQTGFEFTWLYQVYNNGPFTLLTSEIDEGKWIDLPDLMLWIGSSPTDFAPSFLCVWEKFRQHPSQTKLFAHL
ncbi:MAG: NUDIX domain-containing protein [Verrucomicrobia bacterium]|nr:NUDIX domain-containing protein [Verrucomicrobiota bacterium]